MLNKELAKQAVEANRQGELVYQDKKTYQSQLKLAEEEEKKSLESRTVLVLPSRDTFQISKDKNFQVLRFLAGPEQAKKYLENLAQIGIEEIQFYLPT